jgi:hypothetical protein
MPTDTQLPTMIHLYLELVEKLQAITEGHDTQSILTKTLNVELAHYLWLIRGEMDKIKKGEEL